MTANRKQTHVIGLFSALTEEQHDRLRREFGDALLIHDFSADPVNVGERGAGVEIAYGHVGRRAMRAMPNLKWIHAAWTGVDSLLHEETLRRRPVVTNTRGVNAYSMAEHVLAGVLYLARDFRVYEETNSKGVWRPEIHPVRLEGSCALVLGTGALATVVVPKLNALGVRVLGVNTTGRPAAGCDAVYTLNTVRSHLKDVDWLIALLPGTPHTAKIVNASFLAALKPGAGVINVGRGAVIDQEALIAAIDGGHVRGAVLDVTDPEPLPAGSPLFTHPKIMVTSHQSWLPPGGLENGFENFVHNLHIYLAGDIEHLKNRVSLEMGY